MQKQKLILEVNLINTKKSKQEYKTLLTSGKWLYSEYRKRADKDSVL